MAVKLQYPGLKRAVGSDLGTMKKLSMIAGAEEEAGLGFLFPCGRSSLYPRSLSQALFSQSLSLGM